MRRYFNLIVNWALLLTFPIWGGAFVLIMAFSSMPSDFADVISGREIFWKKGKIDGN